MTRRTYAPTFLRAWREHRNLTLDQAVERLRELHNVVLTKTSLSRIERGKQPYSQPILEGLADAYETEPASLLIRDPSDPEALWSIWDQVRAADKPVALEQLLAFTRRRAGK